MFHWYQYIVCDLGMHKVCSHAVISWDMQPGIIGMCARLTKNDATTGTINGILDEIQFVLNNDYINSADSRPTYRPIYRPIK